MELAGRYAYPGCEYVVRKVIQLLDGEDLDLRHSHHKQALLSSVHDAFRVCLVCQGNGARRASGMIEIGGLSL